MASADRRRWACPNGVPKCGLLDDYEAPNPSHMCGKCGYLYCGICAGGVGGFTCGVCARGSDGRAAWGSDDDTEADDGGAGAATKAKAMQLLAAAEPGADEGGPGAHVRRLRTLKTHATRKKSAPGPVFFHRDSLTGGQRGTGSGVGRNPGINH